jgi:hypothetical protein
MQTFKGKTMLDFQAIRNKEISLEQFLTNLTLTPDDLRKLTNEMIDSMLDLISTCDDADVTFEPDDPNKHDKYATNPDEVDLVWNLGHVIVHTTASSEESAALAAEMARGVAHHGRSRAEMPWQQVKTISACRQRLEESRRMRLASLDMWPQAAHLEMSYEAWPKGPHIHTIGRFIFGLMHDDDHLGQIKEIVRQSHAARSVSNV